MRQNPGLNVGGITRCLEAQYGLCAASVRFLPLGFDPNASVYEVRTADSTPYFLKVRFGSVDESSLLVPWTLIDHGVPNILGPLQTRSSALWAPLDGYPGHTIVLYPFVPGENATVRGMSDVQWKKFGSTLRAVHDSGLEETFRGQLRSEDFARPSAVVVRQLLTLVAEMAFTSAAAARFAAFWRQNAERLHSMLTRAESLGRSLQSQRFEFVLCHADIHEANILVGDQGQITLID